MALVGLLTLPIILQSLAPEDYGKWQYVLAFQVWFVAFSAPHITFGSKRGLAKGLDGTFIFAFLKRSLLVGGVSLLYALLGLVFYFWHKDLVLAILFFVFALQLLGVRLLQVSFLEYQIAKSRFRVWSFWQSLFGVLPAVFSTLIAWWTHSILWFVLSNVGLNGFLVWLAWLRLVRKEKLLQSYRKKRIDYECYQFGLRLVPMTVIQSFAAKIGDIIIGSFFGFANLAVFAVARNLKDKSLAFFKTIPALLYADFVKLEQKKLKQIIHRYLFKMLALNIVVVVVLLLLGGIYIRFFLPLSFQQAFLYFVILCLGLVVNILTSVLATVLNAQFRYKELTIAGIFPNLFKVVLVLLLGLWKGVLGVCIAITLAEFIVFGFYYTLVLKEDWVSAFLQAFPWLAKISQKF